MVILGRTLKLWGWGWGDGPFESLQIYNAPLTLPAPTYPYKYLTHPQPQFYPLIMCLFVSLLKNGKLFSLFVLGEARCAIDVVASLLH